jgi:hypothetical protein
MEKKYKVSGNYNGIEVDEIVNAYSKKQAKLKAGFIKGFGGRDKMKSFMNSKKIKVRMVK